MPDNPPAIRGIVNVLRPFQLRGWALVPDFPDRQVPIEARLDDALIGTAIASVALGPPRGDHGFIVVLQQELSPGELKRVEVSAIAADGLRVRLGLAKALTDNASVAPPPAEAPVTHGSGPFTGAQNPDQPVFVLGSARSGTTAMTQALRECAQYEGHGEGHLFTLLPKLLQTTHGHYGGRVRERAPGINTMLARVSQPVMEQILRQVFVDVARGLFKTGRWLEKTPGPDMIRAAPQLRLAWPHARFVFMKRHPIPNIESRRRKFPTVSFNDHCRLWADCMTGWEDARPALHGSSVEIDQMQLAERPQDAVAAIAALIGLRDDQSAAMLGFFGQRHPERTAGAYTMTTDPRAVGWTDLQIDVFKTVCGPVMARYGYQAEL